MLNVHCNTVQRGGKGKMKRDSHPLACQHSGRWHLFLRLGNLKLGTSLGHKADIPILGSKQRLNLQGQHEGLAGKRGPPTDSCLGAHSSCSWSEVHTGRTRGSGDHPSVDVIAATGASAASRLLSFPCTDQPWPRTVHMKRRGDTTNSSETGKVIPDECCFPQSIPPLLIFPKPLSQFARWNSVDRYLKEMRYKCSLGSTMF